MHETEYDLYFLKLGGTFFMFVDTNTTISIAYRKKKFPWIQVEIFVLLSLKYH